MIKVAIVEDNIRYKDLLKTMISASDKFELVYEADNCRNLLNEIVKDLPDVVIMDIDLPGISGIEGVKELKEVFPEIKVLMLTVFEDEDRIFGSIKAGANGYMLKKDSPQKILDSISELFDGKSSMNGIITKKVLEFFQQHRKIGNDLEEYNLTARENQFALELMKGFSYKEIASNGNISVETLNSHIKNLYKKLDVHSRSELAAKFANLK